MMTLRLLVVWLLYIQTAPIYVRHIIVTNNTYLKHVTSSIDLSSFLQSSNHYSTFTKRLSDITTKSGSSCHSLHVFNTRATQFPTSVSLNDITQQNTASSFAIPVTFMLLQRENKTSKESSTDTLQSKTSRAFLPRDKRVREKGMPSAKVTASEAQWLTHDFTVLEYKTLSYLSNFYDNIYTTSVSFTRQRTGTAIIDQAKTAEQTKASTSSYSEAHRLFSSFNLGSSESYQTNVLGNNSITSATQISITFQITITSTVAEANVASANSISCEAHSSCFRLKTSLNSFTNSSSQTPHPLLRNTTYESGKRGTTLITNLKASFFSKAVHSSLWFSNQLFNHSIVRSTLALTKFHITSHTSSKNITRTMTIIPGPTQINTAGFLPSKSCSKTPTSSQSKFDLLTSRKSDYHSSTKQTNDGRPKETRSTSHFTSDQHSRKQNQKSATITVNVVQDFPDQSEESGNIPLYVLAICLPLALLVGFGLAFIYFKRSKQHQRLQYSVTVEMTSQDRQYELKRMYSVIDINAGNIIKDFWPGLDRDTSRNSIFELKSSPRGSMKGPT